MEMDTTFVQSQIDFIPDTINELRKLLEDLKSLSWKRNWKI